MTDAIHLRQRLVLHPAHGVFDFLFRGQTILHNATAAVTFRDARGHRHFMTLAGSQVAYGIAENRVTLSRTEGSIELTWNATLDDESYFALEVANRSREPIQMEELRVLSIDAANEAKVELGLPPLQWRLYQNGWQSWSAAYVRSADDGIYCDPATEEYRAMHVPHTLPTAPKTLSSEWFTVLTTQGEAGSSGARLAILLGFTTTANQLGEIRLQIADGEFVRLDAVNYVDGVRVDDGDRLASERLLFAFDDKPLDLLERYAARLGEAMHARVLERPQTGWCTWYYFYGKNSERDVIRNIERIRSERLPLSTIVIDGGYQTTEGDWTSVNADKYPHGMKWLADEIKRAGFEPALWVAPFAANENSNLAREHPEFLLRDESGKPVFVWQHSGGRCYSLDLSRSDVQTWLRGIFRILCEEWGYESFKLDFLYTAAAPGVHSDSNMTRARALRRGLETIRECVGDRKLLGCGAPLGPCVGLVDALRIGPDVAINWEPFFHGDLTEPATAHAMRNTIARAFMHNRLWHNDPDCVLVRRRDDESELVLNEMRSMVSLVGLSGGAVLSSDNLPSIRRGRLKYLKQILPPTNRAARALDMFDHELPRLFVLPIDADWAVGADGLLPVLVAVTNWEDETKTTEIALEQLGLDEQRAYHCYNYWHRRYFGIVRERVKISRHQPHETRMLLFKPVSERTELLATTFHIAQGLCEVKKVERREELRAGRRGAQQSIEILRVELVKPGVQRGQVLFTVPKSRRVIAVRVDERKYVHRFVDKGILAVGLTLDERAVLEVEVS